MGPQIFMFMRFRITILGSWPKLVREITMPPLRRKHLALSKLLAAKLKTLHTSIQLNRIQVGVHAKHEGKIIWYAYVSFQTRNSISEPFESAVLAFLPCIAGGDSTVMTSKAIPAIC